MSNAETEAKQWPQTASAGERSVLVTVAGALLLLLPYAALTAAIVFATPQSSLSKALRTGSFPISAVAIGFVPLTVFTFIGLARHSPLARLAHLRRDTGMAHDHYLLPCPSPRSHEQWHSAVE